MNKSEIAGRVVERTGVGIPATGEIVEAVFEVITEALASGEEVRVAGIGVFGTRSLPARTGRNPRTGERVEVAPSTAPTFRAGKLLRDAVRAGNGP